MNCLIANNLFSTNNYKGDGLGYSKAIGLEIRFSIPGTTETLSRGKRRIGSGNNSYRQACRSLEIVGLALNTNEPTPKRRFKGSSLLLGETAERK